MYEKILEACKEWLYSIQTLYADQFKICVDVDNSKEFVANIDSGSYLSQLVVSESGFRPYNFVEYTVLDVRQDINSKPKFWYGDKEGDAVQEIINNLNKGLKLMVEDYHH